MSYDASQVAFVDIETTGLDPELDYIWEIAVIVNGEEHCWQQRIPEETIPWEPGNVEHVTWQSRVSPWVLENTRIQDTYDHTTALLPFDSIDRLESLVRGRHLVGACPWFDSERLHRVQLRESDHRDLLWHYHLIDVENLAVGYIRGMRDIAARIAASGWGDRFRFLDDAPFDEAALPWKSVDLSRALGVDPADFEPKHSALADARWAKAIYERIMGPPR